ncbi:MAG TPA: DNA mismatch repair endonuclease MutL [Polyangiaceae bacterium]|nr:DNA mismatch repair endonuclease MutL [Polyangiaceae bacterium]
MGVIQTLPTDLANQIAAGEVVERPASVVKELVENALDAGATRVKVELERGGATLIRVTDDGAGMDEDDAVLALQRHATSKIRHKDDLFALTTFGFRGEALPSIASVSKLRLSTRARGAREGVEVLLEGGGTARPRPTGAAEGTSVEVRDLFFNVPARRKFLKSTGTEAAHVSEALLLAALARPDVSFFLVRDGRTAREWLRAATRRERAAQAFDASERLEACSGGAGPMQLEAHLAPPERARAGAAGLHLLVNGRAVRDRALARAVAQAYGSVLEPGRYPVGVVYVEVPAAEVDVNVHPQKAEVRFADARALFDAVTRELHAVLARAFSLPALGASRAWMGGRGGQGSMAAALRGLPTSSFGAPPQGDVASFGALSLEGDQDPWKLALPQAPGSLAESTGATASAGADPILFEGAGFYASLEFLAQVRGTFLVCSGSDGLYILDQHAAAERVTFNRLRKAFASRSIATQRLLIPDVIELLPTEVATLEERSNDVAGLGIDLRAVGSSAVAVHAVPALLARARPERIVRDLVAELGLADRRPFGDAADLVLATMACHGSIRAGDVVSRAEAGALLRALDDIDFAGHCPHGRPVVTRIGYDELERRVGR